MKYPDILDVTSPRYSNTYEERDVILYALSIGMGDAPFAEAELDFVYEKRLRVVPTMATVLCAGAGDIIAAAGVDFRAIVNAEHRMSVHAPLPTAASVESFGKCVGVVDQGERGAQLIIETQLIDAGSKKIYASNVMTLLCRADGGFGGPSTSPLERVNIPTRQPDRKIIVPTRLNQAMLYRLNGDRNPLHCDPAGARAAGFDKPILHGHCTFGIACRSILGVYCNHDPARIRAFDAVFSSPVYPGESISTLVWEEGATLLFESHAADRGAPVLKQGRCLLA